MAADIAGQFGRDRSVQITQDTAGPDLLVVGQEGRRHPTHVRPVVDATAVGVEHRNSLVVQVCDIHATVGVDDEIVGEAEFPGASSAPALLKQEPTVPRELRRSGRSGHGHRGKRRFDFPEALRGTRRARRRRSTRVGLFEVLQHPDYPGERLVACRNRRLATQRAHTRESLLQATEALLEPIRASVVKGRLQGAAEIGLRVGQVRNRYKVAKHFVCDIDDERFDYRRGAARIDSEAALDGIYIIRTSLSAEDLSAADCVRSYKALTRVERAFRTLKTDHLQVRPIRHRLAERVRAHIFLCVLAYYVEWHMREAWRPLLFAADELAARARTRDPVAPAEPSASAKLKKATRQTADGTALHSFRTLLEDLAGVTRNSCRTKVPAGSRRYEFELDAQLSPAQEHAMKLLKGIRP